MRDRNGYELNAGSTIAALLYGDGDFVATLTTAFNFGWDADNNAATAGTVIGVVDGYRAMMARGWQIVDRYENRTRDGMPKDETIISFADRIIELAVRVIVENGGILRMVEGRPIWSIPSEQPGNVMPLVDLSEQVQETRKELEAAVRYAGRRSISLR